MKKIIVIFLLFLILALGAWYFLFRAPSTIPATTPIGTTPFGTVVGGQNRNISESKETGIRANTNISVAVSKTNTPWKLTDGKVAGFSFVTTGTSTKVIIVEKGTGRVYKSDFSQPLEQISNRTINKTVIAKVSSTGKHALLTKETDSGSPETYLLDLSSNNDPVVISQSPVYQSVFSPSGKSIAFIQLQENSISVVIKDLTTLKTQTLWSSPVKGFLLDWPAENSLLVTTKPSSGALGFSYKINLSGVIGRVGGGLNALVTKVDRSGKKYVSSFLSSDGLSFIANDGASEFNLLPKTFSDKCVWENKNTNIVLCFTADNYPVDNMPDAWYQGLVSINDSSIWKFDINNQTKQQLSSWDLKNFNFDAVSLQTSANDDFIGWINKNDDSLWVMKTVFNN